MLQDYKETLNLPKTEFPMKGNLPEREPVMVTSWSKMGLYEKIIKRNKNKAPFVMHDGPPYANGHIHFGHILNKVLKDIVVKYANMTGRRAEFVPGWDCHGLPIELQVEKELGKDNVADVVKIRERCEEYAKRFVGIQREEFRRLGVLADWENPYLTLHHHYEATIAKEFGKFVRAGYVYRGRKPVYWCASCQTALAEAEVEYNDHKAPSIYVKFRLAEGELNTRLSCKGLPVYAVIWTTTPWTIPSNLAIAFHPNYKYVLVRVGEELWIIAEGLVERMMGEIGVADYEVVAEVAAAELENGKTAHPLVERDSLLILGDHVTLESGTGCVHTAPGHGREDFEVGMRYGLSPFAPIDDRGCFTEECGLPDIVGLYVEKANRPVIEDLKRVGALVWEGEVSHTYPHCWRCKRPIVFRSTEQWFISLEHKDFRKKALEIIDGVTWIPRWGRERIYGMVESRPDWCISRQRAWGVPIIAVRCVGCGEGILSADLVDHVAGLFEKQGSNVWFTAPIEKLLPKRFKCPACGKGEFSKEADIIDVWFESGVSYAAVVEGRPNHHVPVDLYLEGSDQHRGWFHSALLSAVATREAAPYRAVLTHGFVVDAEGKKYSKSARNYVPPEKVLNKSGAELLRLWVAAEDYRNDIRVSDEIMKRLTEAYRKIRNTCRFILGNLGDYNPQKDAVKIEELLETDRWILHRLDLLVEKCRKAYDEYQFHVIYHALNEFCVVALSSFYLDIVKDRLYCDEKGGVSRRSAQTAMWIVVDAMVKLMAPILSFTAEDVWTYMPEYKGRADSVHLTDMPETDSRYRNEDLAARWDKFVKVREEATKVLEVARREKVIGNSLEARLVIEAPDELKDFLTSFGKGLADLFIVSGVDFHKASGEHVYTSEAFDGLKLAVHKIEGEKCERCWKYHPSIGSNKKHPTICGRCVGVVEKFK